MPTAEYNKGFRDAVKLMQKAYSGEMDFRQSVGFVEKMESQPKRKRKMSAWNKYVKANSNKPRFRYRNGKLNLKKMGVAFRKTPAGKKKR
jgi:hypothetical protein